jgi:hypothetical protein
MNPSQFLFVIVLALIGCGQPTAQEAPSPQTSAGLPEVLTFLTKPSDHFLVDIREISRGHPLLGVNSPRPR